MDLPGNDSYSCLFGEVWAPYVRTPYLVHEEQFDYFQLAKRNETVKTVLRNLYDPN